MKKITQSFIAFIFLCLFAFPISAQQVSSASIDEMMENALKKFKVAGAAIAVVKNGSIIHCKGYGLADVESKSRVNEKTNFQIASNSKAFTAAALSILVDEGKLSWKDKVKKHIPEFTMYNEYVEENFNIQDLLTHRSGLGTGVGDLMLFPDGSNFGIKDILTAFQHFKPVSAFRTQFDYDNLLYIVAGEVVARVSGMSFENFVQQRILLPLEMKRSFVGSLLKDKSNLASPHSTQHGPIQRIDAFDIGIGSAAGGIYSNVEDMSKWMICMLNKGKYGNENKSTLFSLENYEEMLRIHTVEERDPNPRYNNHFSGYGLGWGIADMKGTLRVSHTGGLPGMLSQVTLFPDLNLGIVILTNTESGGGGLFTAVTLSIADSYLNLDNFGWVDKLAAWMEQNTAESDAFTKEVWQKVEANKNQKINHSDFIGIYEDTWFGKMEVYEKEGKLWIKSHRSPKLTGPLAFYNANTFAIKWEYRAMNCDAFAMFMLDENGKAQGFKMKGISPTIDFSFDFQDLDLKRVK